MTASSENSSRNSSQSGQNIYLLISRCQTLDPVGDIILVLVIGGISDKINYRELLTNILSPTSMSSFCFLVSPMPPTRAVKSVGRANLLKNIQATSESSQDVIDDGPLNSSNQSAGPSKRVTTIAEFSSDEDDFFVPTATQMALGVTQTPADQVPTDTSVLCMGPA